MTLLPHIYQARPSADRRRRLLTKVPLWCPSCTANLSTSLGYMHKAVLAVASVASTASTASALTHEVRSWTDAYGYCKPVRSPIARTLTPRSAHTPFDRLARSRVTTSLFIGLTA